MQTQSTAPRFRVWSIEEQTVLARFGTTKECYKFLQRIMSGELEQWNCDRTNYFVDDVIEDLEVNAEEFMEVFDVGECPGDLSFF